MAKKNGEKISKFQISKNKCGKVFNNSTNKVSSIISFISRKFIYHKSYNDRKS